jgi:hypothetical protein
MLQMWRKIESSSQVPFSYLSAYLSALDIVEPQEDDDSEEEVSEQTQEVLAVQSVPIAQRNNRQTLKLLAQIGKHQVLILVDSGSVGTFVNETLVTHLKLPTVPCDASTIRAANGGLMLCDQRVPQLKWFVQGHTFVSDARVLPLKCYDLILGEDWLEDYNPLLIDYKLKTLQFSVEGKTIKLQGVTDNTKECKPVSA